MRIQNNIMAMNTHRMYTVNNNNVAKSAEKLSSGYRINRAGDDAAGLAISEKMRAQIRGLNMASKNSQDAVSLIQTAEGALQEVHSMLQRMNEISNQSATGTNDNAVDRAALQQEFSNLQDEIDQIADTTTFNDMKLLDGSLRAAPVEGGTYMKSAVAFSGKNASDTLIKDGMETYLAANAGATADEIAAEQAKLETVGNAAATNQQLIKGVAIDNSTNTITITGNFKEMANLGVGGKIDDTGKGKMFGVLVNFGGDTAPETTGGSDYTIDGTGVDTNEAEVEKFGGKLGDAVLWLNGGEEFDTNGAAAGGLIANADGRTITIDDGTTGGKTYTIKLVQEDSIHVPTEPGAAMQSLEKIASAEVGGLRIQVGAKENETLNISVDAMNTKGLNVDRASVSIATQEGASKAITATRTAINMVSTQRAQLGALQNRLEHKIANLDNTAENLQSAESRIRDVDIAKEMTSFTKNNILSQAATAMLAQANAAPQGVLSLLQ